MNYKSILLLLSLCSINVHAFDVVAAYSVESVGGQKDCEQKQRTMSVSETPEELFDSIMNTVSDMQSRSCSRGRDENKEMLYFISCSVTRDNQSRGFASVLTSNDVDCVHKNEKVCRSSIGSPISCSVNVLNLRENLSRICDDIKVDYTYMRAFSPFTN